MHPAGQIRYYGSDVLGCCSYVSVFNVHQHSETILKRNSFHLEIFHLGAECIGHRSQVHSNEFIYCALCSHDFLPPVVIRAYCKRMPILCWLCMAVYGFPFIRKLPNGQPIFIGQFQKPHTTAVGLLFCTLGGKDCVYYLHIYPLSNIPLRDSPFHMIIDMVHIAILAKRNRIGKKIKYCCPGMCLR